MLPEPLAVPHPPFPFFSLHFQVYAERSHGKGSLIPPVKLCHILVNLAMSPPVA